jgi:hypothetical protein
LSIFSAVEYVKVLKMADEKVARVAYREPTEAEKRNYYAIYELVFDSHFRCQKNDPS